MKLLNGSELAGYIKERQAKEVRALTQASGRTPRLAIIRTNPDPVVDSYMKLKARYGQDIGVAVEVYSIDQSKAIKTIKKLNKDSTVHGIIVQIPVPDPSHTDEILNSVASQKDVDGLAEHTDHQPATPLAIDWLLAGYNVDLSHGQKLVIVGDGRLVGRPLSKIWKASGYDVTVADISTADISKLTTKADVLVTATGVPSLIKASMVRPDVVIVDAGVATDKNGLVGDVDPEVRQLPDIKITPEKGGVGPLTVSALFQNVINAARATLK